MSDLDTYIPDRLKEIAESLKTVKPDSKRYHELMKELDQLCGTETEESPDEESD